MKQFAKGHTAFQVWQSPSKHWTIWFRSPYSLSHQTGWQISGLMPEGISLSSTRARDIESAQLFLIWMQTLSPPLPPSSLSSCPSEWHVHAELPNHSFRDGAAWGFCLLLPRTAEGHCRGWDVTVASFPFPWQGRRFSTSSHVYRSFGYPDLWSLCPSPFPVLLWLYYHSGILYIFWTEALVCSGCCK